MKSVADLIRVAAVRPGRAPRPVRRTDLPLDDYAAVALLVFFGVSTILDAAEPKMEEEKEDAVAAVGGMSPEGALLAVLGGSWLGDYVDEK
eukprot:gene11369-13438_t